jgi:hypothetical protein
MISVLQKAYPSLRLHLICKLCRGDSARVLDRHRCGLCKKRKQDYCDANLEREVAEMSFLRDVWIKARDYHQNTTGTSKLDLVITMLWGPPHSGRWRDYSTAPDAARFNLASGVIVRSCQMPEQYVGPPL